MIHQIQTQKQSLKILPQQVQFLNLIQLNGLELEQYLKNELEANPALEEKEENPEDENFNKDENDFPENELTEWESFYSDDEIPAYKTKENNASAEEIFRPSLVYTKDYRDDLEEQVRMMDIDEEIQNIAIYIIGCLDNDGYLRISEEELLDDFSFKQGIFIEELQFQQAIYLVQKLEPAGVGARNIQECILIQLDRKPQTQIVKDAKWLVENHLKDLTNKNYERIKKNIKWNEEHLIDILNFIKHIKSKPVDGESKAETAKIQKYPDYVVNITTDNLFEISLNLGRVPAMTINEQFAGDLPKKKENREARNFVKQKVSDAKWLLQALNQREKTMLDTIKIILALQKEYFITGDISNIKPMILKNVAELVNMDISTISRVTSGKYIQTPFGIISLKQLFTESMTNSEGDEVSNKVIQEHIKEIVENENKKKPYTDQKIAEILGEKGFPIARRTIAKYRDTLHIPTGRMRKEI